MRPPPTHAGPGQAGTRPVGAKPLALILVLALAVSVHACQRATIGPQGANHPQARREIVGKAWVIDGDTIDVSRVRIRLLGIDAPESDQTCTDAEGKRWYCGHAATHALIRHLSGQQLRCAAVGFDRYHRVLAVCTLPDGADVNAWLVREGWAVAYGHYRAEEAEAHAAKRGIWTSSFIQPSQWRRQHRHRTGMALTPPAAHAGAPAANR
jgi:endonuclease YncB( thermonuclease family)